MNFFCCWIVYFWNGGVRPQNFQMSKSKLPSPSLINLTHLRKRLFYSMSSVEEYEKRKNKCPSSWLRQSKQNQPSGQTNMWLWSLTQSMHPIQPLQFLAQPDFSRFNCCPFDSVLNIISFQVSTVTLILFWSIITLIFFWSPSLH